MADAAVSRETLDPAASLDALRREADECERCPLHLIRTQTVFGVGPADARLMIVGEAPGRTEDELGTPFVGAAGGVFDEALAQAGIDRDAVYVTNAVKHRPWVETPSGRGKNRPPKQSEVKACALWLDGEIATIRPRVICCLGAVAAKRVIGPTFRLMRERGELRPIGDGQRAIASVHPSYVMLQRDEVRQEWLATLSRDLVTAWSAAVEPERQ